MRFRNTFDSEVWGMLVRLFDGEVREWVMNQDQEGRERQREAWNKKWVKQHLSICSAMKSADTTPITNSVNIPFKPNLFHKSVNHTSTIPADTLATIPSTIPANKQAELATDNHHRATFILGLGDLEDPGFSSFMYRDWKAGCATRRDVGYEEFMGVMGVSEAIVEAEEECE
jgi:hypothetical protein